jgi:hypothetical protein
VKAPSFQWYPKDAETDENVKLMDFAEYGLYHRCLDHAWINRGLPSDLNELARLLRCPISVLKKLWPRVSPCLLTGTDGRLTNPKQEQQRGGAGKTSEVRRAAANARWSANAEQIDAKRNAFASRLHPTASATAFASATTSSNDSPPTEFLETIQAWIGDFVGDSFPKADIALCRSIYRAMNGASLDEFRVFLIDLHARGKKPGKSLAWFVTVTEAHFSERKNANTAKAV